MKERVFNLLKKGKNLKPHKFAKNISLVLSAVSRKPQLTYNLWGVRKL